MARSSLTDLFIGGRYAEIVDRALLDGDAHFSPDETPAVVGALAALGQLVDAELLLTHQRELLSEPDQAFALYHLAAGAAGRGRYEQARRLLGRLFALRWSTSAPVALFFVYQGIAYYRFATGRLANARGLAHRAASFARRSGSPYALLLSHELLAHVQMLTGDLLAAFASLQQALTTAAALEREDLLQSLGVSSTLYTARYRQTPSAAVAALTARLGAPADKPQKASLYLELIRQHALAGDPDAGMVVLTEAMPLVLGLGSTRFEVAMNLRLADLLGLQGMPAAALIVCQAAQRLLNAATDPVLELEVTARQRMLLAALDHKDALADATRRVTALERRTGCVLPPALRVTPAKGDALRPRQGASAAPLALNRSNQLNPQVSHQLNPQLNHRQEAFLRDLGADDVVDVHAYRRRFQVSEITACRDLSALARGDYLRRTGRARATRYTKGERTL
jgi:hypothetical protein